MTKMLLTEIFKNKLEEMGWEVFEGVNSVIFETDFGMKIKLLKEVTPKQFIDNFCEMSESIGDKTLLESSRKLSGWYKNITGDDKSENIVHRRKI